MSFAKGNSLGPLSGMTVVDMSTSYAGPSASMYLADLGAEVIKVERPGRGDDARSWGPPFTDETSVWFASANRNKKSVVINLREEKGKEILHRLIASADVFIQNMNPSKLNDLAIDAETLQSKFPRLIYCAVSGFGLNGPDSSLPGYDLVAQARSGIMSVTGPMGGDPQRVSAPLSDVVTGMCAAMAVSAAAVRQAVSGVGEVIDVSLMDSDLAILAPRIASYLAGEPEPAPSGGTDSVLAIYQSFPTADRNIVVAIGNDDMWVRFCGAVGLPELGQRPELHTNEGRRSYREEIVSKVSVPLRERSAKEWLAIFDEQSIPASLIKSISEVVIDPHVKERGAIMPVPESANAHSVHSPFRLKSLTEPRNERYPDLGADTAEALLALGFERSEISEFVETGVVQSSKKVGDMAWKM